MIQCGHKGCERSVETGHAMMRLEGTDEWRCSRHHPSPDPLAMVLEQQNLSEGGERTLREAMRDAGYELREDDS